MSAILTKDPPELDTARLAISPGLERIVRRCLEKSPELRFQSANDLAFALETLSTISTSSATRPACRAEARPKGERRLDPLDGRRGCRSRRGSVVAAGARRRPLAAGTDSPASARLPAKRRHRAYRPMAAPSRTRCG